MTDGQDQSPESDSPSEETLRMLYGIGTRNIEFAKSQQWRVLYYISLVYAAFIYLDGNDIVKNFQCNFYWLIGFAGTAAVALLITLQKWMSDERQRIDDVKEKLKLDKLDKSKSQCARTIGNWFVFVLMVAVIFAGAWITVVAVAS